MMFIIRNIENPLKIKAYGHVTDKGMIGHVPEGYEEVEVDSLPEGYEIEPFDQEKGQIILDKLTQIVQNSPVELRIQFAVPRATVTHLLNSNDVEAAEAYINSLQLPKELEETILQCF